MEIKIVKPKIWNFEIIKGKNAWKEVVYGARLSGVPSEIEGKKVFKMIVENDYTSAIEHVIIKFDLKMTKGNACLTGDIIVFGENKPIKEIYPNELVIGKEGQEQKVLATFKRIYEGDLVKVKVMGLPFITLTPEHPVFITHFRRVHRKNKKSSGKNIYEWVDSEFEIKEAKDLKKGDYLIVPRPKTNINFFIKYRKGRGRMPQGRDERKFINKKINKKIAELFGLWVAEGSVGGNKIIFSLGIHEKRLAQYILKIAEEELDIRGNIFEKKEINSLRVALYNKDLAKFLVKNFNKGALNKRVPVFIKNLPVEILRGFVDGLIKGDGNINKNKIGSSQIRISTSSKQLAYDLLEILYKIGIAPSLYQEKPGIAKFRGKKYLSHTNYTIRFSQRIWDNKLCKNNKRSYSQAKISDNYIFLPLQKVETFKRKIEVYNLKTIDSTFCIPFLVHNCEFLEHRIISHTGYSTRYIKVSEGIDKKVSAFEIIMPWHLLKIPNSKFQILNGKLKSQKLIFLENVKRNLENYEKFLNEGLPRESARYILPFCQAVGIYHVTMNLRSLLNLLGLRLCVRASPEFRCLASQIYFNLIKKLPIMRGLVGCRGFMRGACPENEVREKTNCPFKNRNSKIFIPTIKEIKKGVKLEKFDQEKVLEVQEKIFKVWANWEG
jgi:flavin-dependent thymidylate synthase